MKISTYGRVAGFALLPATLLAALPTVAQADSGNPPGFYRVVAPPGNADGDGLPFTSTAQCEAGDTAVNGGELSRALNPGERSFPIEDPNVAGTPTNAWRVELFSGTSQAYAICEDIDAAPARPTGSTYIVPFTLPAGPINTTVTVGCDPPGPPANRDSLLSNPAFVASTPLSSPLAAAPWA